MFKQILALLWKIPLCAIAFYGGTMLGGIVASAIGLPTPEMPAGTDQMILGQYMLLTSLILAAGLAILARNLPGHFAARWLTIAFLVWIGYGVGNILEGSIFTSMDAASLFTVVLYVFASLLCGAAVAWLFPPRSQGADFITQTKAFFERFTPGSWAWRILAAILAFPLIYLAFGRMIAPIVTPYYEQGLFGLSLPGWDQILPVIFMRSLLFMIACLPVLILWTGSPRRLFLVLGPTLFLLVGGLNMLQAYWMPTTLRVVHSLEILADELAYTGILVALFSVPKSIKK